MVTIDKAKLRKQLLERRQEMSPEVLLARSQQLCRVIRSFLENQTFTELASFRSFRGEPLLECLEMAWASPVYYPRIDPLRRKMDFHRAPSDKRFVLNRFGIEEPSADEPLLSAGPHTLMLVPALAFDRSGHRLGYGAGFYDRYLLDFPGTTIGVCFEEFRLEVLPFSEHDQPVNHVATDAAIYLEKARKQC